MHSGAIYWFSVWWVNYSAAQWLPYMRHHNPLLNDVQKLFISYLFAHENI